MADASLTITKISGVIFFQNATSTYPKSFTGAQYQYQASDDGTTILIVITESPTLVHRHTVAYGNLTVGTTRATTMSQALTMLNSIFGT